MSPSVSRLLKRYAASVLPDVVQKKYPDMVSDLQRWLKRWWVREMNFKERAVFRKLAERGDPLPEKFKKLAREVGVIVQWPPPSKEKQKPRKHWGKPRSWRAKTYGKRRF